jgi:RNA polymerase sigma-70 factor, ECF subfamily
MLVQTQTTAEKTYIFDRDALVAVYQQHSPGLYRYAYRLLGDPDLAEDCVADTFSRLLQAVKKGGGPGNNIQAYLYRTAHNWVTDHYRGGPPPVALEPDLPGDPLSSPPVVVGKRLERARIRAALLKLTGEQRQVIVLRFLENWSHDEIGAAIGKTAEATRALQHRALIALRSLLTEI